MKKDESAVHTDEAVSDIEKEEQGKTMCREIPKDFISSIFCAIANMSNILPYFVILC